MRHAHLWMIGLLLAVAGAGCSDEEECLASFSSEGGPEAACVADGSTCFEKPQICPDLSPIAYCERAVDTAWPVNVQLRNHGEAPMTIRSLVVRGDERCAFSPPLIDPPLGTPIQGGDSAIVRIIYRAPGAGADNAALEFETDAENFPKLIIPLCGAGTTSAGAEPECLPCEDRTSAEVSTCSST